MPRELCTSTAQKCQLPRPTWARKLWQGTDSSAQCKQVVCVVNLGGAQEDLLFWHIHARNSAPHGALHGQGVQHHYSSNHPDTPHCRALGRRWIGKHEGPLQAVSRPTKSPTARRSVKVLRLIQTESKQLRSYPAT